MVTGLKTLWRNTRIRRLRPVVIGGCARSGTSLLLSMLSSHRQILAIPDETQLLCPGAYWPPAGGIFEPDTRGLLELISRQTVHRNCRAWCEKTPRNVLNVERILAALGSRARFIHLVRDGRDVVLSRHPKKPEHFWVDPDRWVNDVRAGVNHRDHPQLTTIRYEDLIRSPQQVLGPLCEFLSLEYDDRLDNYPQHATVHECEAWFEPARPLSDASIGRWMAPGNSARVQQLLDTPGAIELLKEAGYDV